VVGLYQPLADGWMTQPDQTLKIQKAQIKIKKLLFELSKTKCDSPPLGANRIT
jgi:hypothetical protein